MSRFIASIGRAWVTASMPSLALLEHRLQAFCDAQKGVFTYEQALRIGIPPRTIQRRLQLGKWVPAFPRIFHPREVRLSWEGVLSGAVLWGGGGTVVSHASAAALWELAGFGEGPIEITTTRRQPVNGIKVHHSGRPPSAAHRRDLPVTTVERTLLDLCGFHGKPRMGAVLDDALRRRLTSFPELRQELEREARSGRPGIRLFRELLDARDAGEMTDSRAEDIFRELMDRARLRPVHHHVIYKDGEVLRETDFTFLDEKINIEIDGYDPHSVRAQFDRDREIDAELRLMGWEVLRFTWNHLTQRPDWVIATVRATLEQRRAA